MSKKITKKEFIKYKVENIETLANAILYNEKLEFEEKKELLNIIKRTKSEIFECLNFGIWKGK